MLITIAVIGFATGFFQSIVTTSGEQARVKNSGAESILKKDISFLVGGSPVDTCGGT